MQPLKRLNINTIIAAALLAGPVCSSPDVAAVDSRAYEGPKVSANLRDRPKLKGRNRRQW